MNKLPENSKLILKAIVGSQSYGLATPESDTDFKSLYAQSNEDILSNKYVPQVDINKDDTAYELRRFLELVSTGNPNVLELLYLPERCIIETSPEWEYILKYKEEFLTKKCYNTFANYAKNQIRKASGLNKKFNYEKDRIVRKDIVDFMKVCDREDGNISLVKKWLENNGYTQDQVGLTSIDGFRDCYKLYVDEIKWAKDNNHRFDNIDFSSRGYKGIMDDNSNQPKKSVIEKYMVNDWKGIIYWNREEYSSHCKEYREYEQWLKNRNENRVATNKKHGQQLDGKNLLHTVRLIMTAQEIPTENKINVDRTENREYLLSIKKGEVDLKSIMEEWGKKADELEELYVNSSLKEEVNKEFISNLELKLRNNEI